MRYANKATSRMISDQFIFRPTTLAAALQTAGITQKTHLVLERKVEWPKKT